MRIANSLVLLGGIGCAAFVCMSRFSILFPVASQSALALPITITATVPVTDTNKQPEKTISLIWVGDMVPTDNVTYNKTVFENVAPLLQNADITIGNFEGTLAKNDTAPDHAAKCDITSKTCFAFRGDQTFVDALKNAGFDFVNLANNHSLDFGKSGLTDTETTLAQNDINFVSILHQTNELTVHNIKVGILGISSSPIGHNLTDYDYISKTVTELKSRNDIVVVLFHGGAEGIDKTEVTGTEEFQGDEDRGNVELLAHTAIDTGADLVLGSGPHVLRKIEQYKNGLIAYSLGNFEGGNGKLGTKGILGKSGILKITISPQETPTYELLPISLSSNGVPNLVQN